MKTFAATLALLLATPAIAQTPPPAEETEEVIVIGQSLDSTRRALADCLKRKCPPAEDMAASVAHAENAFVAGEYKESRATLTASLGRNRRHAKTLPVEVSGLERANGRVAAHLGEKNAYQFSTWGVRRALKAGLPDDDMRLVAADVEIGDMLLSTGRTELARQTYARAARNAARLGNPDLAARARVRGAWLENEAGNEQEARALLRELSRDTDPAVRTARLSALILLARMDRADNKADNADTLVREVAALGLKQPVLLWAPPIRDLKASPVDNEGESGNVLRLSATDDFEDRWIDVGFWVEGDGNVREAEVIRSSGDTSWSKPLMTSIAGRRYSSGGDPAYRVERYSYTSFWEARTGTRLRQRSANARIEFVDLTADPDAAKE